MAAISAVTLFAGRMPPLPRLGALGQLDFEHLDLRISRDFTDPRFRERAVQFPHAVFRGADLHDDIAAAF